MKVAAAFAGGRYEGKWPLAQVQYLADVRAGDGISAERIVEDGPVRVFGGNGLRGFTDRHNVDGERVLVGRQGALCGNVHTVDGKLWASEHALVVTPTHGHHHRWLGYVLQAADLGRLSVAAAQPGITRTAVATDLVPMAPQADQQRIANYLDRETAEIDAMDAELDRLVETLEDRRTKMVLDAFDLHGGPGVRNAALQSLARFVAGSGFPLSDQGRDGLEIPFYKVNALGRSGPDGVIAFRDHSISRETADRLRAEVVRAGASVIAKIGAALMLGRVRMLGQEACIDNNMLALVPTKAIEDRFLFWFLHTVDMNQVVNPSTIPFLNERALRAIRVPLPPLSEQRKIVARLDEQTAQVDDMVADAQRLKSLLAERRSTLITDVVTGKKEVPA